ncbi:MAG: nucleotide sugar dehydrogenase [Chlorobi bacterium]|nr:nucleotide sugar dehydrogenase [Chlorobiota bacterium]
MSVDDILSGKKKIAVIGLGYVGLPVAVAFGKQIPVIGYDISKRKIDLLKQGIDPAGEVSSEELKKAAIEFSHDSEVLADASVYIVTVPTPVDSHKVPDLGPLKNASQTIGKYLKPGDIVVYESTVFPGCTEEICVPILERTSGLKANIDFFYGYSPERINPGDNVHTLENVIKVVSGSTPEITDFLADLYGIVVKAGIHKAPSIKVAEAAKVIENTQRDLNIALMNELSIIFDRMNINTYDVIDAASTKWNFIKFTPGLVGGHCIGVDPYYLTYKAQQLGYNPQVILSGRRINDEMPLHVASRAIQMLAEKGISALGSRILVMGVTFKENVKDIRNSKVFDLIRELRNYGAHVDVMDLIADPEEVKRIYGETLISEPEGKFDMVIVAVAHNQYKQLDMDYFKNILHDNGVLIDLKGIYRKQEIPFRYWTL